jgi:transposase
MHAVTTIGLDIAKSVFQVHGVDAKGNVVIRRQLKRRYVLVGSLFATLPWIAGSALFSRALATSRQLSDLGFVPRARAAHYPQIGQSSGC